MSETKPCPFCGGTDLEVRDADKYTDAEVVCMNDSCGASVAYGKTRDAAVAVWNRRAAPEPAPDDRERAKEFEGSLNAFSERKDVRERLAAEFARVREAATKKERERCERVAESLYGKTYWDDPVAGIAAAIRRGEP